jgi:hypothetical protein
MAVASPVELIVATLGLLTVHVTELEIFEVVVGAEPSWPVPVAVYCAVWPTAVNTSTPGAGVIEMAFNELQPASARASGNRMRIDRLDSTARRRFI